MPKAKTSNKNKRKHAKTYVSAAVSIDEVLYQQAIRAAVSNHEGNFSRYMRALVKRDLGLI